MSEKQPAREVLDGIKVHADVVRRCIQAAPNDCYDMGDIHEAVAPIPTDVARLVATVEAVLRMHKPNGPYLPVGDIGGEYCRHDRKQWPCPTVAAIDAALKEGE